MPEPTAPTPKDDDKAPSQSGFDPRAYEDEMAAREEATRMQELPPSMRVYRDVISVVRAKLLERVKQMQSGDYDGSNKVWSDADSDVKQQILDVAKDNLRAGAWGITEKNKSGAHKAFYLMFQSIMTQFELTGIEIPSEVKKVDDPFVVVDLWSIYGHSLDDVDDPENRHTDLEYWLVLSPERGPVVVQTRLWDTEHKSIEAKLSNYPNHRVSDEDCINLIQTLKAIPV